MELTSENYFSQEASAKYLSVSQYKSFLNCEARTLAGIKGEYVQKKSKDALLFGSLLHSWNEINVAFVQFQSDHPELYCKTGKNKGQLKSNFKDVYKLIESIQDDDLFTKALAGQKEIIFTANMFGVDWKICIDSYNPDAGYITDLKAMANITDTYWSSEYEKRIDFIHHYKYDLQMVVYSEIERLANNRKDNLVPYLAVATKQDPPDKAIYKGFLYYKDVLLQEVSENIPRIIDLKAGLQEPKMCNTCDYCRSIKKTQIIEYRR